MNCDRPLTFIFSMCNTSPTHSTGEAIAVEYLVAETKQRKLMRLIGILGNGLNETLAQDDRPVCVIEDGSREERRYTGPAQEYCTGNLSESIPEPFKATSLCSQELCPLERVLCRDACVGRLRSKMAHAPVIAFPLLDTANNTTTWREQQQERKQCKRDLPHRMDPFEDYEYSHPKGAASFLNVKLNLGNSHEDAASVLPIMSTAPIALGKPFQWINERWKVTVYPTAVSYQYFDLETKQTAVTDRPIIINKYHNEGVDFSGSVRWLTANDSGARKIANLDLEQNELLNSIGSGGMKGNHEHVNGSQLPGSWTTSRSASQSFRSQTNFQHFNEFGSVHPNRTSFLRHVWLANLSLIVSIPSRFSTDS